jgi:hypothetical protein
MMGDMLKMMTFKLTKALNKRENNSCIAKNYAADDKIMIKPIRDPYEITQVHDNGTVTIDHGIFRNNQHSTNQTIQLLMKKILAK